ncbi:MAG: class I SAM-dependent methyltransferase [Candidatus Thorarchaeota archaeon]
MGIDRANSYHEAAEYYDLFASNYDLDFYRSMADSVEGSILELACGTGRVTLELAKRGHEIVGLDATEAMLSIARSKAQALGADILARVTFISGNISDFKLNRTFDLIIIPSSFKFNLTTEEQLSCLRSIKDHLSPEGLFILDHFPGGVQAEYDERREGPIHHQGRSIERHIIVRSNFIDQLQRFTITYAITHADGTTSEFTTTNTQALIFEREIELLLRLSGFTINDEYGDWDFTPPSDSSGRRIFILESK